MKNRCLSPGKILSAVLLAIALTIPVAAQARNSQHVYGNQQNNYYYYGPSGHGYPNYVTSRNHRKKHKHFYKNRRHARHEYYNQYRYLPPPSRYYGYQDNFSLGIRSGNTRIMIGY
jgi:hypothetical protein